MANIPSFFFRGRPWQQKPEDQQSLRIDPLHAEMFEYNSQWAKPGPYYTKLTPADEQSYQTWLRAVNQKTGRGLDPNDPTYDMRGFWKKMSSGKLEWGGDHFPDTFKTPYHPTFSQESRYATPDAPRWVDDMLVDNTGNLSWGYLRTIPNRGE